MLARRAIHLGLGLGLRLAVGVALLGHADLALAQRGDIATANALFDAGRRLSAQGRVAEACARFEASAALVPQLGVQLNLADCYERLGKTASAWLAFGDATALARRLSDPSRWRYALERQAALRRRLSRIIVTVAPDATSTGLAVTRDGVRVSAVAFGVEVPVDPGEHAIEAMAPGRIPWSRRVTVSRNAEVVAIEIPELARAPASARSTPQAVAPAMAAPAAPAPAPPTPAPPTPAPPVPAAPAPVVPGDELGRRRPTRATWIAGGVSAAGLGVGAYFGLSAVSQWHRARPGCDRSNTCGDVAFAAGERAHRDAAISTAGFAVAGAALVTGLVLYVRSPRRPGGFQIAAAVASDSIGIAAAGGF